jgi:hypothetical protein
MQKTIQHSLQMLCALQRLVKRLLQRQQLLLTSRQILFSGATLNL